MNITSATAAPLRLASNSAAPAQTPAAPAPPADSASLGNSQPAPEKGIAWGNVAFLGAATVGGAAAGIYSGLNPGPLAELVSWALVPGAAIGGAVLGGVLAEKFSPQFLGEYPAIGGAIYGGLAGAGLGITQMFLAGSHASPILATTMGITGAMAGIAGSVALLIKARD